MDHLLSRLPPHERRRLEALGDDAGQLARRRLAGEPLQYLEGTAAFTDFEVAVDSRVLIPRPETEGLYELAARLADDPATIVDLGCGSGALAIALGRRFGGAEIHATDISREALTLAESNARRVGVLLDFHHGDLFEALPARLAGRVDLLVSNPPYVSEEEWPHLPEDVRHEPRLALVAGPRGTEVLERIAAGARKWLAPRALLMCEMGETQAASVIDAFSVIGEPQVHLDLAGRPRYVSVRAQQ